MTHRLTIDLTVEQWAKLQWLAAERTKDARKSRNPIKRTFTPEDCVRGFIETCQPGGDGWLHPAYGNG